jgi:hypothetical protein
VWSIAVPGALAPPLTAPTVVRLADGAILVLGGAMTDQAWIYRPSLIGPALGSLTVAPVLTERSSTSGVLTAPDPSTVDLGTADSPNWQLSVPPSANTSALARALVGGPRIVTGSISATVSVRDGGVALIAQQTAPGHALVAELAPGRAPQIVQLDPSVALPACAGASPLANDLAGSHTAQLAISDHDAAVTLDGSEVVRCALHATDRGAWGIASLTPGASLVVATITVARQ